MRPFFRLRPGEMYGNYCACRIYRRLGYFVLGLI